VRWLRMMAVAMPLAIVATAQAQDLGAGSVIHKAPANAAPKGLAEAAEPSVPLSLIAVLVTEKAADWGVFDARASVHFSAGGNVKFYIEPRDYKFKHSATTCSRSA
jgi:hypothetical protein